MSRVGGSNTTRLQPEPGRRSGDCRRRGGAQEIRASGSVAAAGAAPAAPAQPEARPRTAADSEPAWAVGSALASLRLSHCTSVPKARCHQWAATATEKLPAGKAWASPRRPGRRARGGRAAGQQAALECPFTGGKLGSACGQHHTGPGPWAATLLPVPARRRPGRISSFSARSERQAPVISRHPDSVPGAQRSVTAY